MRRFFAQFDNVLIGFLIVSAIVAFALNHVLDASVIMAVVIINATVGFGQEGRAERALEAIRDMILPRTTRCAMATGSASMQPIWCRAMWFCWNPAIRCPPICGYCGRAGLGSTNRC